MNRVLFAAIYAAIFSEVAAIFYFTINTSIGRATDFGGIIFAMMNIALFALLPATLFGATLGSLGGWFLPLLTSPKKKVQFIFVAAIAGAFLGCVPPVLHQFFHSPHVVVNQWEPGFLPFVIIGTTCAASWAMLEHRHSKAKTNNTATT